MNLNANLNYEKVATFKNLESVQQLIMLLALYYFIRSLYPLHILHIIFGLSEFNPFKAGESEILDR